MVGSDRLGSRWNCDIDADGLVVGWEMLAVVGDCLYCNICRSGISTGVAWDEIGWFEEDVVFRASDASKRSDALKEVVE